MDDFTQLAAAKGLGKAQRQHRQILRHRQPQIGRHPERRQMGAQQCRNVNEVRQHRKQHCHPAVMGDVHRLRIVRRGIQHIPQDLPDVHKGHQCHQCADRRQHPRSVGEISVVLSVTHQPGKIGLFFHEKNSFKKFMQKSHRPLPFLFVPAVAVGSAGGKGVLPHKFGHTARFAHGVVQMAQGGGQVV